MGVVPSNSHKVTIWLMVVTAPHLHKGECWPRAEGLILVFQLVAHILLHTLIRVDSLFLVHAEQGSRRHSNGDCILRLGLQRCRRRDHHSTLLCQPLWVLGTGRSLGQGWTWVVCVGPSGGLKQGDDGTHPARGII